MTAAVAATAWRVVGASVQGTSHRRAGLPCQDAHGWTTLRGGAVALAAADGAGSAAHAERGAAVATEAALAAIRDGWSADPTADAGDLLARALAAGLAAVDIAAAELGTEPRELATTLLLAVLHPAGVAAAQVGDGAVVAEDEDGAMHALTLPPRSEFANETVFLTSPGALAGAATAAWARPARRVALFTDGLQGLALRLPPGEPHAPFFAPLFRFAAEAGEAGEEDDAGAALSAFLSGPRVTARADDDLTLLLAVRTEG